EGARNSPAGAASSRSVAPAPAPIPHRRRPPPTAQMRDCVDLSLLYSLVPLETPTSCLSPPTYRMLQVCRNTNVPPEKWPDLSTQASTGLVLKNSKIFSKSCAAGC